MIHLEIIQVYSALSILGCLSVITSYSLFPRIRPFRHIEIIFYIAINELIASIGTVLGYRVNGTPACIFQGLTSNYNFLSAILWNTVISYQLMRIIQRGSKIINFAPFHFLCWGFPLLTTLLPFTTNAYGNPNSSPGWCFIGNRQSSPPWGIEVWDILSLYIWMWIAIISILLMYAVVFRTIYSLGLTDEATFPNLVKFSIYPLILIICWTANTITNIYSGDGDNSRGNWATLPALQGFLNAIAFFFTNRKVHRCWWVFFQCQSDSSTKDMKFPFIQSDTFEVDNNSNVFNDTFRNSVASQMVYNSDDEDYKPCTQHSLSMVSDL